VPRLFALDHNFPDPIVAVLGEYQVDAELRRVDQIDPACRTSTTGSCCWRFTTTLSRGTA
jgi:hypothetical protein